MNKIVLCEGKMDAILLSCYLMKTNVTYTVYDLIFYIGMMYEV